MNLVGKEYNNYFFKEALGSGSFGSVYKVEKQRVYLCSEGIE